MGAPSDTGIYRKAYQTVVNPALLLLVNSTTIRRMSILLCQHSTMQIEQVQQAMEYFVAGGINTMVDTNDTCTVTTAVYY